MNPRRPAGSPDGQGGRFAPTAPRPEDPTPHADIPLTIPKSGGYGLPPDPRFPDTVDEFTTDFGECPCGNGRMAQNDQGHINHEEGFVGHTIKCSDTGDLLGGSDYDIDPATGDLLGGQVQWYEACSNEPTADP